MVLDARAGLATVHEAAQLLGVAPKTIRRWISDRRLPVVRLGRAVRIRRADIARIVEKGLAAVEGGHRESDSCLRSGR